MVCPTPLLLASLLFLTSCAIKNEYAELRAPTSASKNRLTSSLNLEITDHRSQPDVGYIKNILGMKTGRILPKQPVASVLYESMTRELGTHAIGVAPGPLKLTISIEKCYATYTTGLVITKARATIILNLALISQEGKLLYSGTIKEEGTESPVFFYSGKNTGAALSKALSATLRSICSEILPYIKNNNQNDHSIASKTLYNKEVSPV